MNRLSRLVPITALSLLGLVNSAQGAQQSLPDALDCKDQGGYLCAEVFDSIGYKGGYTGHDEPSLLFYSNVPGSGNYSGIKNPAIDALVAKLTVAENREDFLAAAGWLFRGEPPVSTWLQRAHEALHGR